MVKIVDPNLGVLKSLRPVVTFSQWKGKYYAKARKPKGERQDAPAVVRNQERFSRVAAVIRNFTEDVRNDWRELAQNATCTWKDSATGVLLAGYHAENLLPMTLITMTHSIDGTTITATIDTANIFAEEGYGWGNLGWSHVPWGCPPELYEPEGFPVVAKLEISWTLELEENPETFFGSPRKLTPKKEIPKWHSIFPRFSTYSSKADVNIEIEHMGSQMKDILVEEYDDLEEAKIAAKTGLAAKPWRNDPAGNPARFYYNSYKVDEKWSVELIAYRAFYTAGIEGVISQTDWPQWQGLRRPLVWSSTPDAWKPLYVCYTDWSSVKYEVDDESVNVRPPQENFGNFVFTMEPTFDGQIASIGGTEESESWVDHEPIVPAYFNTKFWYKTFSWEMPTEEPHWIKMMEVDGVIPIHGPVRHVTP